MIEQRILQRFLGELAQDQEVPPQVARRLGELCDSDKIHEKDRVLKALREGVREHAQD